MARNAARFGNRRSTFVCQTCGHLTREAGENDGLELCPICAELAGLENTLSDSGEAAFRSWNLVSAVAGLRREARAKRNDAEFAKIEANFSSLLALVGDAPETTAAPTARRSGLSTEELVEIVKENARRRYEQGGDYIIETCDDAEIARAIGASTTAKGAIFHAWRNLCVRAMHEQRRAAKNA